MPPAPHRHSSPSNHTSYPQFLAAQVEGEAKGARTAQALRIAACTLLERAALQDLTVAAICKQAGVANGTFYLYFPDQAHLLDDLLQGFAVFLQAGMIRASQTSPERSMRPATEAYARLFETNRGLMKCLIHHLDAFPAAREAFHRLNREWIETVVTAARRRLVREGRGEALPQAELLRRAYALGGMTDQYFSSLYLSQEPGLVDVSTNRDAVITTLTTIWERGLQP